MAHPRDRQEPLESLTPPGRTSAAPRGGAAVGPPAEPPGDMVSETITSPAESSASRRGRWGLGRFALLSARVGARVSPRTRGMLAVLLVVVSVGSWAADQHRRSDEFNALIAAARQGQATIDDSDRRVASMIEYVSPLLHAARTPADVRAGLQQIVRASALEAASSLRAEAAAVASVPLWPWHGDQVAARGAYVTDLRARATYYDHFMTPGATNSESALASAVRADWLAARSAFLIAATNADQRRQVELVLTR